MALVHEEAVFELDEAEVRLPSDSTPAAASRSISPESPDEPLPTVVDGVELSRKAIVVQEEEVGVCPICLDEFVDADPGMPTTCGHCFHLQCIMQWAQRSHECPMCFKNLALTDEDMNALLPFGEYTPQHATMVTAGDESWDLERLLIRLAAANHRHERRAARRAARQAAAAAAAAREAQRLASAGGRQASAAIPMPATGARTSDRTEYPSSWPPVGRYDTEGVACPTVPSGSSSSRSLFPSRTAGGADGEGSSAGTPSMSLKARLAKLNLKESFHKATKEIKSALFSPTRSQSNR